jgi:hypothetical protein
MKFTHGDRVTFSPSTPRDTCGGRWRISTLPMRSPQIISVVMILAFFLAAFFQHRQSSNLQDGLAALTQDQASLASQIRKLERQIKDLQIRPTGSPATAARRDEANASRGGAKEPLSPLVARPGVTVTTPEGWGRCGNQPDSYVVGVDALTTWGGMPSADVESRRNSVSGFGGMMQTMSADDYVGKRICLSGGI